MKNFHNTRIGLAWIGTLFVDEEMNKMGEKSQTISLACQIAESNLEVQKMTQIKIHNTEEGEIMKSSPETAESLQQPEP